MLLYNASGPLDIPLRAFGFLGPGLPRIQPFVANAYKFTLQVKFKEQSCLTL